jgi:hypothetical protein
MSDQPADDIAAVDVEDHVEMEAGPLGRAFQFGDIPGPHFVGPDRQEFGFGVERMDALTAALAGLAAGSQQPIPGADRAVIAALIEQRGIDRGRRHIGETLAVENAQQQILLGNRERQRRSCPRCAPCSRRLSLPEKLRRLVIATTSGSRCAASGEAVSPVALRAPSATASPEEPDNPFKEDLSEEVMCMSYLYSKLPRDRCSTSHWHGGLGDRAMTPITTA